MAEPASVTYTAIAAICAVCGFLLASAGVIATAVWVVAVMRQELSDLKENVTSGFKKLDKLSVCVAKCRDNCPHWEEINRK
jgi:hypothetical protein